MPQSFKPFPPLRRRASVRPLADLVGPCIGVALGKHGFGETDILMHWPEIVGATLADRCEPLRLQWRPRTAVDAKTEPATLIIRVESAFALSLQHMGAVVVEKVNAYLGWRCVGKIALRQGPLPRATRRPRVVLPPDPQIVAQARALVGAVEDESLREALTRLGGRVLRQSASVPGTPRLDEN